MLMPSEPTARASSGGHPVLNAVRYVLEWPLAFIVVHFEKRLFEFCMATIALCEAVLLFLSPQSIAASSFRYMLEAMSANTIFLTFLAIGVARLIALGLNGHWMPWGALVRCLGALAGAVMWAQWVAALLVLNIKLGLPISPGVPVYAVLAIFEIVSMYRAGIGAVTNYGSRYS